MASKKPAKKSSTHPFVASYGELIFDLCKSILRNSTSAQFAFRSIFKKIKRSSQFQKYSTHEKSWILRITYDKLLDFYQKGVKEVTPQKQIEEQMKLSAHETVNSRLKQFDSYFHRLRPENQFILLLKDKYGVSYSEIATAMGIPEASLKMQRQQALRTLEEWLWNLK